MGLESGTYLDDLVISNPDGAVDPKSQGDDHIRLIKTVLKNSFPDVDQAVSTIIASTTEPTLNRKATVWFDETTSLLKIRNAGDTAWVTLPVSITADNTADIDGGAIDGTPIGGTTPAAGNFTTLDATGNVTVGGTVDGRDLATDGTKLDGIEAGAQVNIALASQAEAEAGTENTKTMTPLRAKQSKDYWAYESAEQTVTVDTLITLAHGLSAAPTRVSIALRCKTTELGYAVGDEIIDSQHGGIVLNIGGEEAGISKTVDATNIKIRQGSKIFVFDASFNSAAITPANWKWVVRANL